MRKQGVIGRRWVLNLASQVGEVMNASANYLGIAVLVIVTTSLLLQPVRDQIRQLYTVLVQSLDGASPHVSLSDWKSWVGDAAEGTDRDTRAEALDADSLSPTAVILTATPVKLEDLRHQFARMLVDRPDVLAAASSVSPAQFQALRRYLSRKYHIAQNVAGALIQAAYVLGESRGVDPQLLLAIIAIESRYNPFAESHVGAQGLMQVMPRVHRDKFQALGLDISTALEPIPNMIVGTQIYSDCRRRRGSVKGALTCYVGATGPGDGGYGAKVLAERRHMARASGIALWKD